MLNVRPPDRPARNWRDFFVQIATITIGLLIAIGLEQAAEAWSRQKKLESSEASVRQQLSDQLAYATLFLKLKPGIDERVANFEAAVVAGDHKEAARLAAMPAPFVMRPWTGSAWVAAGNDQIVSRLPPDRRRLYEILHRQVDAELDLEWRIKDGYATLLGARLASGGDAATALQISAAQHIHSDAQMAAIVALAMLEEGGKLGLSLTPERLERGLSDAASCSKNLPDGSPSYVC